MMHYEGPVSRIQKLSGKKVPLSQTEPSPPHLLHRACRKWSVLLSLFRYKTNERFTRQYNRQLEERKRRLCIGRFFLDTLLGYVFSQTISLFPCYSGLL